MHCQERLLILEDDPGVGKMIQRIAVSCGLEARVVAHAEAFFAEIDSWRPSYIALDLVMPDVDGIQVLEALGRRHCSSKIIITSGMGSRVLDAAGRSAGEYGLKVVGILAKPFSVGELRALLRPVSPVAPIESGTPMRSDIPPSAVKLTQHELQHALDDGQLRVHYQPKISCIDGRLRGFEALVRWEHPQRGLIMPDEFVPLAEVYGLIDELTLDVIEKSLSWFGPQFPHERGGGDITMSINLSAASLQGTELLDRIIERCRLGNVPPERVIFEVTESSAMQKPVSALRILTRMRLHGFELSLDDFGTGYSSMLQLVRMPFSEIKVDRSFVMSATRSQESRAVVKSIVELARSLGLKSAAEGVEDAGTLALLRDIGCDFAQGYFIGRPMADHAVAGWIANREVRLANLA